MKNLKYYQALSELTDFIDGKPYWNESVNYNAKKGSPAGSVSGTGYRRIRKHMDGKYCSVLAHRLNWFKVHGTLPKELHHINNDKDDNRIENLMEVTRSMNCFLKPKKSGTTSKHKGVSWKKANNKWQAQIKVNQKTIYLGLFDTEEEAYQARLKAEKKYYSS